jgi:fluoroacetyl-CoA thioesterase
MDIGELFKPGMVKEDRFKVEEENTALHVGSGASRVLATPWMIAFMERVSHRLLAERLPLGYSSVGVSLNVRHIAPTPVGALVRIRSKIREIQETRIVFSVYAWDEYEQIGVGDHGRVVIQEERFLKRVERKREKTSE